MPVAGGDRDGEEDDRLDAQDAPDQTRNEERPSPQLERGGEPGRSYAFGTHCHGRFLDSSDYTPLAVRVQLAAPVRRRTGATHNLRATCSHRRIVVKREPDDRTANSHAHLPQSSAAQQADPG